MSFKVLLIEDEEIMRVSLTESLAAEGYEVEAFASGSEAVRAFDKGAFSLVISDVRLPDISGLDVLGIIKEKDVTVPVLIMTAYATIKDAVDAMKLGAFDYITKPFSLEEFGYIIHKALEVKQHRDQSLKLRQKMPECTGYSNLIGRSKPMKQIFDLIQRVALTDSTVLILGESGTGKELVASAIHCQSKRKNKAFVKVNCAAIPENLIESELFGHEKGAFTGAVNIKPGRFETADNGTIFLDEIGDLPHPMQAKLLRVLQDRTFERLGGTRTFKVDVRVIAATNRNIKESVRDGHFREDLYYRLNIIPIKIPPLRDRKEDIPLLVEHFLEEYTDSFGKNVTIEPEAMMKLIKYDFPGNVRELENIIERCVALSIGDTIGRNELPEYFAADRGNNSEMVTLSEVAAEAEKEYIMKVLSSTNGNKTKAAEILGISRKTLWEKVKAYYIK